MKSASAGTIALLAAAAAGGSGAPFFMADLYTITLASGQILYWTNFDQNLTIGAITWTCATDKGTQPVLKRGEYKNVKGTEVGTLDLTLNCGQTAAISGTRLTVFAANGGFDGAQVLIQRCFMSTAGNTGNGAVTIFQGLVAAVDPGTTQVVLHLKNQNEYMALSWPRNLWMPQCNHAFGDAGCGFNLAEITDSQTVQSGATTQAVGGSLVRANGYYVGGVMTFTSGVCNGVSVPIGGYANGVFTPSIALPSAPAPGDTFTAYPGCARSWAACQAYGNTNQFNGFPFVPPPETAS